MCRREVAAWFMAMLRSLATLQRRLLFLCRAAVALVETLQQHCADASATLTTADAAAATGALDPDAVVAVTAALDGCYYALLEHSLSCGWAAAAVPPLHLWFPAMTAAHPGERHSSSSQSQDWVVLNRGQRNRI